MEIGKLTMAPTKPMKSMKDRKEDGFTLVELMITLAVSTVIALSVFAAYSVQSKSFSTQRQIARIQQDLRGALYMMEHDLLNACRDPNMTNRFTFSDVRYYDFNIGSLANDLGPSPFAMPAAGSGIYFASYPVLQFSSLSRDTDGDGEGDAPVTIRYQIYDFNNDGRPDLGRFLVNGVPPAAVFPATPTLVAEGVVAMGFAFAFNLNPDGKYEITRTAPMAGGDPLGNIIWAVDADGDNLLDTNIDVTGDGQITLADDISGDGIINALDNAAATLPAQVQVSNAVAVRIWLLLESANQSPQNVIDTNQYVVADRIIPTNANGFQDRFKRRVKTVTVALRNYRKS
jgi:type IV pilus assembly protein PilW